MRRICLVLVMLTISGLGSGCDELWELEYGKPAAQFLEEDLAASGDLFEGKNITVKGTVSQVDVMEL